MIRGNIIRRPDAAPDPRARGIALIGCRNGLVEGNSVDLPGADPDLIHHLQSDRVKYLNNRTPGGTLLLGYNRDDPNNLRRMGELATDIEDAMLLAF